MESIGHIGKLAVAGFSYFFLGFVAILLLLVFWIGIRAAFVSPKSVHDDRQRQMVRAVSAMLRWLPAVARAGLILVLVWFVLFKLVYG
jgi:hypothetical protein